MNTDRLLDTLQRHEGARRDARGRHVPYRDTEGHLTVGYGRNLDAVGLTDAEALLLLRNDIQVALQGARQVVPRLDSIGAVRQEALVNMIFNLGLPRFCGFARMLAAIADDDWDRAAAEALDSRWAGQVGQRAQEIAAALRTGKAA